MGEAAQPGILALVGPTAVGKTAVSLAVAEAMGAEIVSCYSMQVYREAPVLSQAPSAAELARVPHHLIACVDPAEIFSAGRYRTMAREAIAEIQGRGKRVLIVGGTGLYLKALMAGMCEAPPADPEARRRLWREFDAEGALPLYNRLRTVDPAAAAKLHPNDAKRIIRALEVFVISGKPLSVWWAQEGGSTGMLFPVVGLRREQEDLHNRIAQRQLEMIFEQDAIGEARRLLRLRLSATARQMHGLPDIRRHLDREIGLAEMIAAWRQRVRQYAKRQMTWFRHTPGIRWVDVAANEAVEETARKVMQW